MPDFLCVFVFEIDDMWFNKLNKFTRNSVAFNTNNKTPKMALTTLCYCIRWWWPVGWCAHNARTGDNKMIFDIRKRKFRIIIRSMFSTLETHYKWYIVRCINIHLLISKRNRSIYLFYLNRSSFFWSRILAVHQEKVNFHKCNANGIN